MKLSPVMMLMLLTACQHSGNNKIVFPHTIKTGFQWMDKANNVPVQMQELSRTNDSSTHIVRLLSREPAHFHDHHDLTVTVLSGESTIHFLDNKVALKQGDIVHIPKGSFHWAENTGNEASLVFVTFSPPFDGDDLRLFEAQKE